MAVASRPRAALAPPDSPREARAMQRKPGAPDPSALWRVAALARPPFRKGGPRVSYEWATCSDCIVEMRIRAGHFVYRVHVQTV